MLVDQEKTPDNCKVSDQSSSKYQGKSEKLTAKRSLQRRDHKPCGVLNGVLVEGKDIREKKKEIGMKYGLVDINPGSLIVANIQLM